jgi:glycosyltransferase involved in cell wall biosynthesis
MITFVIPSYNNLKHLKNCITSIHKHAPKAELIIFDDNSDDGTFEWLESLKSNNIYIQKTDQRLGHTILYDRGIKLASNNIVGILHADMIIGPNYVENIIKHLKPGKVVCGTRVEPPLHPPGNEKIIENFGLDSDIFQRWLLAGYELIQSRDAFVYHLTCRGHRWNKQIGVNDDYFKVVEEKARKYYIKKWGSWIENDAYAHPVLIPVYKKCSIVENYSPFNGEEFLGDVNPENIDDYDVIINLDLKQINQSDFQVITQLNKIIQETNDIGDFELGNIKVKIKNINDISKDPIFIKNVVS